MTPLSTAISTRGKSVEGNTDTGMVKARYAPSRPSVRMTKMTGLECCAIQCWLVEVPAVGDFTHELRSDYFSSEASPAGLLLSFAPLGDSLGVPSAGASAASTLILVLSGSP